MSSPGLTRTWRQSNPDLLLFMRAAYIPNLLNPELLPDSKFIILVADASRRVELIERPALFAAFREKAAAAPIPKAHELLEDADRQMDSTYNRAPGTVSFVPPKTKNREEREANRLKVPDDTIDWNFDILPLDDMRNILNGANCCAVCSRDGLLKRLKPLSVKTPLLRPPKPKKRPNPARSPKSTSIRWWTLRSPATAASQT